MLLFGGFDEQDLERALLRKGVGTLAADRHRCADCGRTPLIGERVYMYARGGTGASEAEVCELCKALRKGDPLRSEPVRHSEYGHAVRITVRRTRAA